MKPQSMEEKISYRLFFMGFVGLVCTAVLCLFVFHKAFREQAWTSLEHQADLVSAGYEQLSSPDQLSVFVNGDLRITLIAADGSVVFESATDQQMENHLSRPEIQQAMREGAVVTKRLTLELNGWTVDYLEVGEVVPDEEGGILESTDGNRCFFRNRYIAHR